MWLILKKEISDETTTRGPENESDDRAARPQRKQVIDICKEHQIAQAQYYQWRGEFLAKAPKAFESDRSQRESQLERENARFKHMIGKLTMELKKSEEAWG